MIDNNINRSIAKHLKSRIRQMICNLILLTASFHNLSLIVISKNTNQTKDILLKINNNSNKRAKKNIIHQ